MTRSARMTLILLTVNLAVYFVMLSGWLLRGIWPGVAEWLTAVLALPSEVHRFASAPWTLLTYMFTQVSFVHLTVNMLWLIGFGAVLRGNGSRTLLTYIAGGITGGISFIAASAAINSASSGGDSTSILAGASAAVLAVITAAAIISPARKMHLLLAGELQLKWLAMFALVTVLLGSPLLCATGAAHAGGIAAGAVAGFVFRRKEERLTSKAMEQARLTTRRKAILQKAGRSGFASLSEEERRLLFASGQASGSNRP